MFSEINKDFKQGLANESDLKVENDYYRILDLD